MICHPGGIVCSDIHRTKHIDKILAELIASVADFLNPDAKLKVFIGKKLRIVMTNHMDTGPGRTDNSFGITEYTYKPPCRSPGLPLIAAVESRLPTAGLLFGIVKRNLEALQNLHHGITHLGEHRIHQALDKQGYFGMHVFPFKNFIISGWKRQKRQGNRGVYRHTSVP
jgi:hypothetical protein